LNLHVPSGEVFCLLGANGAGKTTTIKLFLDFIRPTSGSVRINGIDPKAHPAKTKPLLGYIPEQVALYPRLTGLENLQYFASLAGESDLHRQRLVDALIQAGLPQEAIVRRVAGYSKGMRQKVVIALALVRRVRALLLDEPTSGLDPKAAHEFSRLLHRLGDQGVAVLMASHDLYRARESATRIGVMRQGVLVESFLATEVNHSELEHRALQLME
jgi:ABC-2 type transport system ATP-binding protein